MKIKTKKIVFKVGKKKLKLSPKDARKLQEELNDLLGVPLFGEDDDTTCSSIVSSAWPIGENITSIGTTTNG